MVKVKIFSEINCEHLEKRINKWFKTTSLTLDDFKLNVVPSSGYKYVFVTYTDNSVPPSLQDKARKVVTLEKNKEELKKRLAEEEKKFLKGIDLLDETGNLKEGEGVFTLISQYKDKLLKE